MQRQSKPTTSKPTDPISAVGTITHRNHGRTRIFTDGNTRAANSIEHGDNGTTDVVALADPIALSKLTKTILAMTEEEREKKLQQGYLTFDEELVVRQKDRPSFIVHDGTLDLPSAGEGAERKWCTQMLDAALEAGWLQRVMAAVGRIDDEDHLGTGCLVGPDMVVTNAHVAKRITTRLGMSGSRYKLNGSPKIDFCVGVEPIGFKAVLCIDEAVDLALFRLEREVTLSPIEFGDHKSPPTVDTPVAVIGFPAEPPPGKLDEEERARVKKVFGGVFSVKRLAPGKVCEPLVKNLAGVSPGTYFAHDSSTLWGSSGSLVVDLAQGMALGVHFGGLPHVNFATVSREVLTRLVAARTDTGQ